MIYRDKKLKGNFVQIHKDLVNDYNLSPEEKGVMLYLLSQADNWSFYESEIASHFNCGVKKISTILKQLINKGYVVRTKDRDENKRFIYNYEIYETINIKQELRQKNKTKTQE